MSLDIGAIVDDERFFLFSESCPSQDNRLASKATKRGDQKSQAGGLFGYKTRQSKQRY